MPTPPRNWTGKASPSGTTCAVGTFHRSENFLSAHLTMFRMLSAAQVGRLPDDYQVFWNGLAIQVGLQ
jgi:hypothetical protein